MQRPTWVRARVDFDFKNNHYTPGQVFTVADPLDTVLLIAARRVEIAKKPAASAPEPEPPKRRSRRTYNTKDMVAEPIPQPVVEPAEPSYPEANTFTSDSTSDD